MKTITYEAKNKGPFKVSKKHSEITPLTIGYFLDDEDPGLWETEEVTWPPYLDLSGVLILDVLKASEKQVKGVYCGPSIKEQEVLLYEETAIIKATFLGKTIVRDEREVVLLHPFAWCFDFDFQQSTVHTTVTWGDNPYIPYYVETQSPLQPAFVWGGGFETPDDLLSLKQFFVVLEQTAGPKAALRFMEGVQLETFQIKGSISSVESSDHSTLREKIEFGDLTYPYKQDDDQMLYRSCEVLSFDAKTLDLKIRFFPYGVHDG